MLSHDDKVRLARIADNEELWKLVRDTSSDVVMNTIFNKDLTEDMAAEQKARTTYEHLMKLTDDPCVIDPLKFLWAREVVHFQRFGEALVEVEDMMQHKHHF